VNYRAEKLGTFVYFDCREFLLSDFISAVNTPEERNDAIRSAAVDAGSILRER